MSATIISNTSSDTGLVESGFRPAWWLRGPHAQTLWPFLFRSRQLPGVTCERLELPDGDFLDLAWYGKGPDICVLLHGLEGSCQSHYMPGMMQSLAMAGWRVVVIHFRGCSGEVNRLPRSYHSGETGDIRYLLRRLREREQPRRLAAVGFSLGGNVLLKYLGERPEVSDLDAACAVSVPFDLAAGAERLSRGLSQLYQWWLVRALRRKIADKFSRMPSPFDLTALDHQRTFREFDDKVTAPLHGFLDADDYYARSSSKRFLIAITTPTLILQAADDPFLGPDPVPTADELSPAVRLELSQRGGHVGFVSGRWPWQAEYWLDGRIRVFLTEQSMRHNDSLAVNEHC